MDLSSGRLVEEGLAVGIIAAQSIGEPGTQLTMRTFHIGGTASRDVEENELKARRKGRIRFTRLRGVENAKGETIVLGRNGEVAVVDAKGRELEKQTIPSGSILTVKENDAVDIGAVVCTWDPHAIPIIAEVGGTVRYEDCVEGRSMRSDTDQKGNIRRTIIEHKGDLHPQIVVEDATGAILDFYYLPEQANIEVEQSQQVKPGTIVAKTPREAGGTQDITGGLPRVTELFEARKPKDPAVVAEIEGEIELVAEKKRGKRIIIVRGDDGTEIEHVIPHGKQLQVRAHDRVNAGDALVRGPLVPHDILRVGTSTQSGTEAVQEYLLREIQNVYRAQRVEIDNKHVEIVIAQMLRKVKIEDVGDTDLLPGVLVDKFTFRSVNDGLNDCVKVTDPGESDFQEGDVVQKTVIEEVNAELPSPIKTTKPKPAKSSVQLLGITKAAVQSDSFISAASFQETTKVLTEAALAGKVDYLVGLKENVILGHLVPAGTGFKLHQDSQVRIHDEALREQKEEKERILAAREVMLNADAIEPAHSSAAPVEPPNPMTPPPVSDGTSLPSIADLSPDPEQ